MNKAIIFDLDGTLLDTLSDLTDSVNYALGTMGYPQRSEREVRMFVGNGVKKLIDRCIPDESDEVRADVLKVFVEHYKSNMTNKTKPYLGITQALERFRSMGYKIAIVSNKFDAAVKKLSDMYFAAMIDEAIGESERVRKKPAPDSVLTAMELLKTDKGSAVYVGDSDVDVLTAHNASIKCIGVTWGFRDRDVLEKAGADYIASTALELIEYAITALGENE